MPAGKAKVVIRKQLNGVCERPCRDREVEAVNMHRK